MSKRSNDLTARAAAIAGGGAPVPAAAPVVDEHQAAAPVKIAKATPRTRPVRMTVELQPVEHRGLRRLCERYADDAGVPTVAGSEVLRVLLELLQTDARLAARVGKELRRTGGTRRRWS